MNTFFLSSQIAYAGVIADAPRLSEILLNVLQFLLSVVAVVAILALVIAGIRYMLVLQNTNQAESIKKSLFAILAGLLIVMGAMVIVSVIGNFLQ